MLVLGWPWLSVRSWLSWDILHWFCRNHWVQLPYTLVDRKLWFWSCGWQFRRWTIFYIFGISGLWWKMHLPSTLLSGWRRFLWVSSDLGWFVWVQNSIDFIVPWQTYIPLIFNWSTPQWWRYGNSYASVSSTIFECLHSISLTKRVHKWATIWFRWC